MDYIRVMGYDFEYVSYYTQKNTSHNNELALHNPDVQLVIAIAVPLPNQNVPMSIRTVFDNKQYLVSEANDDRVYTALGKCIETDLIGLGIPVSLNCPICNGFGHFFNDGYVTEDCRHCASTGKVALDAVKLFHK